MGARKLNEMKVAAVLLRAQITEIHNVDVEKAHEVGPWIGALALIAEELADAPYMFRDDVTHRIAGALTTAARMDDLYEGADDE